MKINCSKEDLLHGVQTVINAVSNRNTLPILSNILMETEKDKIKLSATDLEVSIVTYVNAEILSQGNITIPAKRFSDIVRELPNKEVSIKVSENHLVSIQCEKSFFKLNGLPKDEFPLLPKIDTSVGIHLAQKIFQDMIRKVIFSVSTDETRYVLNGICFVVEKDKIRLVSTDGHRLSFIEYTLEKATTEKINHIVPSKALHELSKILNGEGTVHIQLLDNQIIFSTPTIVLLSRLIDGQFPNYDQVIPKKSDQPLFCHTESFMSATRRVSLMASDKSNSVKFSFAKNALTISSTTPEVGEAQEELEVLNPGDSITVAYNAKYVLDVLKNIGSEEFQLELSTNLNPGLFRPKDGQFNYLCVIMPMRI